MATASSPLRELADIVAACQSYQVDTEFELPGALIRYQIEGRKYDATWYGWARWELLEGEVTGSVPAGVNYTTVDDVMRQIARAHPDAKLRAGTLSVRISKGLSTGGTATPVAVQAWHEAYGLPIPTHHAIAAQRKDARAAKKTSNDETIAQLRSGPEGITRFNARPNRHRSTPNLQNADLSGCDLSGIDLWSSGASTNLTGAKFASSTLANANLVGCRCSDADFSECDLTGAQLHHSSLLRANFSRANLTRAHLECCDVRGADLRGATLAACRVGHAIFDEQTKWPKKFKIPDSLVWKGVGPDPRLAPTKKAKKLPSPTDFAGFLERLELATDKSKLDKAMKMLKAERFRLFAKVEPDQLVGVVKSQSDPTLVYSCRIGSDGKYACCTQNLNVCGGLRGSPCKHLLVLIVGLAKAGELDPSTAHEWSQASRGQKPELDKDAMTETLLQYKGAEAGEVDWRPTETIPEDFHAL